MAHHRIARMTVDCDTVLDPEMSRITFGEWHDRWWPTILNSDRAPSTISGYESALRHHVLPHLAGCRLKDLRRIDVEEWLTDLRSAGYSNSTIHAARTVAGMVLTSAVDSRIIAANPLTGVRLPKGTSRTRKALTAEQVEDLAALVDPWWRPFILVLAYCGLRPGEGAALRRRHLDDLGRLTIEGAMSEHRGRLVEQDTKTHRARVVQVPASVLEELCEHLEAHVDDRADAPIFTTPTGDRVRLSNWRHRVWQPAVTQLEFPAWATPYVLRHTAASLMAQSGVPVTAAAAHSGTTPRCSCAPMRTCIRATSKQWPTQWTWPVAPLVERSKVMPAELDPGGCRAWISRGWLVGAMVRKIRTPSELHFCVGLPGFEPGTS